MLEVTSIKQWAKWRLEWPLRVHSRRGKTQFHFTTECHSGFLIGHREVAQPFADGFVASFCPEKQSSKWAGSGSDHAGNVSFLVLASTEGATRCRWFEGGIFLDLLKASVNSAWTFDTMHNEPPYDFRSSYDSASWWLGRLLVIEFAGLTGLWGGFATAAAPLTRIADVRQLPRVQADLALPVRVTDDNTPNGARCIVENVFEGLDAPGEWYLNRRTGQLFYYPMPGENMAKAEVVAPFAAALVRLEGDPAKRRFVEHLRFQNLGFAYSKFELPPGDTNSRQGSAAVPAAITLRGARDCAFEQCRISNLGTFAFDVMEGCSDNHFVGNEIANIAGGGFRVNGGTEKHPPWKSTRNNRITDNWLHHYGLDYTSAVGVFLINTDGNTVSHNQIDHGGYTGISVGLVYGYARSVSQNNLIEFNHIHHIGGVLSDMGGIYTLGISPGTILRNNLIHDVNANHYGGWGIYHDEGSTHLLVENNVVYHTKFAPFDIHFAQEVTVRNNIFALGEMDQLSRTKVEPHKSVYFENNIVYWRTGELYSGNWKDVPYTTRVTVLAKTTLQPAIHTFDCDWNLYFNPTQKRDEVKFNGDTWIEWQLRGKDAHSVYTDPLFVNPEQGDFTLKPGSPAFALGFRPIDLSQVGPQIKTGPQPAPRRPSLPMAMPRR